MAMTDKPAAPRGRPVTNEIDPIPASPEAIAKAIFRAAKLTEGSKSKPTRKKPN